MTRQRSRNHFKTLFFPIMAFLFSKVFFLRWIRMRWASTGSFRYTVARAQQGICHASPACTHFPVPAFFFLLFWSRHLAQVRSLTLVFHIGEVSLIWNVGVLLVVSQHCRKGWSTRSFNFLPWNFIFKLTPHAFEFPDQPFHRVPLSIAMLLWTRIKVFCWRITMLLTVTSKL